MAGFGTIRSRSADNRPGPRLIGMSRIANIKFPIAVHVVGQALAIAGKVEGRQQAGEEIDRFHTADLSGRL
jgi:hypothetical protein